MRASQRLVGRKRVRYQSEEVNISSTDDEGEQQQQQEPSKRQKVEHQGQQGVKKRDKERKTDEGEKS